MTKIIQQISRVFHIQHPIPGKMFLIIISFVWFITACNNNEQNMYIIKPQPVELASVLYENISLPVHSCGILSSIKEMRLSFKTGGIVDRIYVKEGQDVKKGDLLAKLNLQEIRAKVIQAQNAVDKATRDFKRINNLFSDSVATLEQKQNAETALNLANANLKIASFNLTHSKINAPTNGKVLKKFIEENELIGPGTPVFYFGSAGEKWIVRVGITDREIINLQYGDSAKVFFDSYPNTIFPAIVSEIAESVDPMTGTYEVELQINQDKHKLMSGFAAKVEIYPTRKQKYHIIPVEALVEADMDKGYVFTLQKSDSSAIKIPVTIGEIYKDKVIITAGLKNIKKVITSGAAYLDEGMKVEVMN